MRHLRRLANHAAIAALWPLYVGLLSYVARIAPWPRTLSRPASFVLACLAVAILISALTRMLLGSGRWAEKDLNLRPDLARLLRRVIWTITGAGFVLLVPALLFSRGLIAPEDRPIHCPTLCRVLVLGFEAVVWGAAVWLLHRRSSLGRAITEGVFGKSWFVAHRRLLSLSILSGIGLIVGLDARGYSYTARRIATTAGQAMVLLAVCAAMYWLAVELIDHHAWRWVAARHNSNGGGPSEKSTDRARRLKRLVAWLTPLLGLIAGSWLWNFDFALFHYLGALPILPHSDGGVTIADVTKAIVTLVLAAVLWRSLDDLFTVGVYPRMPDDAGLRFAFLTLTRYAVLGAGMTIALSSVHLGLERIGMVLAALGVGLGFGLQEIVSNFISGLILLLERPIKVGDIVTVSGMSGRIDRINIRATTIINSDNQSIIVPNREFITSNLVNWTHKDRVVRATIQVGVAYGNCPDRVADLLLDIARSDEDVLTNPIPVARMEAFGNSSLDFALYVHVADPTVLGRVKHRLHRRIQDAFAREGIEIPFPVQTMLIQAPNPGPSPLVVPIPGMRADGPVRTPPESHLDSKCPSPVKPSHRGVDE